MPVYTLIITGLDGAQRTTLADFRDDKTAIADVGEFISCEHPSVAVARDAGDELEFLGAWDFSDGEKAWTGGGVMRLCAISTVAFALCALGPAHAQLTTAPHSIVRVVRPALGETATREVGDTLFEVVLAQPYDALILAPGARVAVAGGWSILPESNLIARADKPGTYCANATIFMKNGKEFSRGPFCRTEQTLARDGLTFTRGTVTKVDAENFKQQLLYQGRSGTEVRLSYREFSGDLARPAFTQDLTFDLAGGRVVGAKGARIEIIDATNVEIIYKVVQPFAVR